MAVLRRMVEDLSVVDAFTLDRVEPLAGELRILVSADFHGVHLFDNAPFAVPAVQL